MRRWGWLGAGLLLACAGKSQPASDPGRAPASDVASKGRIPPDQIQRGVRNAWLEIKTCYEAGLARDANLEGSVSVRFVIEIDGSVKESNLSSTTLPDPEVARCIVGKFRKLQFPNPEGGTVTVVYPIALSPG